MAEDYYVREYRAAREGCVGADRMAVGLPIIPDKLRGDLAEVVRLRGLLEGALACLRHTHDRLIEYPEFETLRFTINAECRALKTAQRGE